MAQIQFTLDSLLSLINSLNHLNPEEKKELRHNCEYAIFCFGEGWEKKEESREHPLWAFFGFSIGILQLGLLGEALKNLKNKENFHEIITRLRDKKQFEGAFNETIIGNKLFKAGIQFDFLNQRGSNKSPDITIKFLNREIDLEITEKTLSSEYRKASINSHKIMSCLFPLPSEYVYFIQIHKPLSSSRAEEIYQRCQEMKETVSETGYQEYHKRGIIDLYMLKREYEQKVPVENRTISAQMPKTDEIRRLRAKIDKKSPQLSDEKPSILIIVDNDFWPSEDAIKSNQDLRNQLEEHVCDHINISALIIVSNFVIAGYQYPEFLKEEDYYMSLLTYNPKTLFTTNKIIIFNEYSKNPLSYEERELVKII